MMPQDSDEALNSETEPETLEIEDVEGLKQALSEAQQKKYNTFRAKLEKTMNDGIKAKMEFKQQTMLEFDKENPDLSSVSTKMQANIELMSASLSENLALFTDFYNALNEKQKGIINKKIKERIESHRNYDSCYGRKI